MALSLSPYSYRAQRGFSLVELAVVLVIMGVVGGGFTLIAKRALASKTQQVVTFESESFIAQVIEFAQRNHRLPCADNNADGVEDCAANGSGVPYVTLLMNQRPTASPGGQIVYRVSPDLRAVSTADTPPWRMAVTDSDDFCRQIATSLRQPLTLAEPAIIERGANCTVAGIAANSALVLVDSGSTDANASGSVFDGVNGAANNCYEAPSRAHDVNYDDTVTALSKSVLAGVVCQ